MEGCRERHINVHTTYRSSSQTTTLLAIEQDCAAVVCRDYGNCEHKQAWENARHIFDRVKLLADAKLTRAERTSPLSTEVMSKQLSEVERLIKCISSRMLFTVTLTFEQYLAYRTFANLNYFGLPSGASDISTVLLPYMQLLYHRHW